MTRFYDAALAPAGVGLNQYAILSQLKRAGSAAQNELADRLGMDRSTLGHLLKPLERRGLVEAQADPHDRRRKRLSVSDDGRRLLAVADPLWRQAEVTFRDAYGGERSAHLRQTLQDVTGAASRLFETSGPPRATLPPSTPALRMSGDAEARR